MFADILERCRDLFSTDRRDVDYLFRRGAHHDEPSWISDQELYANVAVTALRKAVRGQSEEAAAATFLEYLRRRNVSFPYSDREALLPLLMEHKDVAHRTVAWAEQICSRSLYSVYRGTVHMGSYLDWYSDLNGKSWFFEHVHGMRQKIYQERMHETLKLGPMRATWDLNTCQHLVELGKAYFLSGDERYAAQYVLQKLDWMEKNPPNMGINWVDEMSTARRLIAWIFALQLFLPSAALTPDIAVRSVKMVLMHGAYLADYLRRARHEDRSAYLLAATTALYFAACVFAEFRSAARWKEIAETLLPAVLEEEFGEDGAHHSGSIDMHRLCCEFALLPHLLGHKLPEAARHRTVQALSFLAGLQEPSGQLQPIGAAWPERALPFGPPFEVDVNGLLCLAAVLFSQEDLRRFSLPTPTLAWLGGKSAVERFRRLSKRTASSGAPSPAPQGDGVTFYPQASLAILRDGWGEKDMWSVLRTVPQRSAASPDNVHDDWLHLSVVAGGIRILTDTGSLVTDDRRAAYFNSPAAHNVLIIRNAEPVPPPQGAGQVGAVFSVGSGRTWVRAGSRAWKKEGHVIWHRRDVLFDPVVQSLCICDVLEGEEGSNGVQMSGEVEVEASFQSPLELEVVQRGDLGCIFWKGVGLLRLHPYFPSTFRGFVERARENGPPAWYCRGGIGVEPLQRIRYTARLQLPSWMIFWITWNASGAATPSLDEVKALFTDLGVKAQANNGHAVRAPAARVASD